MRCVLCTFFYSYIPSIINCTYPVYLGQYHFVSNNFPYMFLNSAHGILWYRFFNNFISSDWLIFLFMDSLFGIIKPLLFQNCYISLFPLICFTSTIDSLTHIHLILLYYLEWRSNIIFLVVTSCPRNCSSSFWFELLPVSYSKIFYMWTFHILSMPCYPILCQYDSILSLADL